MITLTKSDMIVLQTKLNRPNVTKGLVVRPRLLKLLDSGYEGAVTLVVAPAGFGKTTLVSSWLQTAREDDGRPIPSTWLSLDEGDSDSEVFLRYFIAAIRVIFPDACPQTLKLVTARQHPPNHVLVDVLSNEIEQLPSRFIVVFDDLHTPHGTGLFSHLNSWLSHWPRQMHLILLSRFNPPLPLSSLRAKGLLTEIRSRELRFTQEEAMEYYSYILKSPPEKNAVALLQKRMEGWIAGLKMASFSMSADEGTDELTSVLLDSDVFISDYLVDEVIKSQPTNIQQFLLKTSILDQFTPSLAEELINQGNADCDAHQCIDYLEMADLFLISLDKHRGWYRYHDMFRDVLRQRLAAAMGAEVIRELHSRAAEWFAVQNLPDLGIHHALEAGDLSLAVGIMEQSLAEILNHEDRPTLERWLRSIPLAYIDESPMLTLMTAFNHGFRWELAQLDRAVTRAEEISAKREPPDDPEVFRKLTAILKGQAFYHANEFEQAVACTQDATAQLPAEWRYVRGLGAIYTGLSLQASGRPDAAAQYLAGQYEANRDNVDSFTLRLLQAMSINYIQAGNYESAERMARTMLRQARQAGLPVMEGWGNYLLGYIHLEWNNLAEAEQFFKAVISLQYTTQIAVVRSSMMGLGHISMILGRREEAFHFIDQLSELDLLNRGQEQLDTIFSRARLMLLDDDVEAAEKWVYLDSSRFPDKTLAPWMECIPMTMARILIARNKGNDTKTALRILNETGELAERSHTTRALIDVLALRALALLNLGDSAGARDALIRSVELARHGRFIRTYVNMGSKMQKLLTQIAGHPPVTRTVGRILAAFPVTESAFPSPDPSLLPSADPFDESDLGERLTPRELEVLVLMAEPISLKAIAARLHISYATARRYTINVYSKFGVHSRWEAVDSAVRRGLISPP